jgi:inositol oxygenase
LVLDGGFVVPNKTEAFDAPEINSFGNSFRFLLFSSILLKEMKCSLSLSLSLIIYAINGDVRQICCRDYNAESERQKTVEEFYRQQHINQSYDYVRRFLKTSSTTSGKRYNIQGLDLTSCK